jgi:hypothetical protein
MCLVYTTDALSALKTKPQQQPPQLSTRDLPKFNKQTQRWEKASTAEQGYPLYETALRNGPGEKRC